MTTEIPDARTAESAQIKVQNLAIFPTNTAAPATTTTTTTRTMCIVLVTKTKKYYIVLSNRDEFLARPTLRATWWCPAHPQVLAGRDLARPAQGTWLGITRQGRIAVLTNYREETEEGATGAAVSRGEITKEFLLSEKDIGDWIQEALETGVYKDVGGFSLLCGVLGEDGYAVLSNRSSLEKGLDYVGKEEYICDGLSNSLIHDEWPKVKQGKKLVDELTRDDINNEEEFIENAFGILSYVLDYSVLTVGLIHSQ